VPSSYDPRKKNPVIVLLHCLDCWYTVFDVADLPIELAEKRGALIVTPFAYGEGGHYELEAQKDVFEVLSDVSRRYSVDQERLYLTGMSMGALGTYRLGGLFPDLWARLLAVESYTTPFCVTPTPSMPACTLAFNYLDLFPNYRNVPVGITQGALDELTPVTGGREFADVLTSYGYPVRYWEWPNRTHDPKMHGLTTDVTSPFLGDARRERSPASITYVQDRAMRTTGQVYDRAYWLARMHLADGVRMGRVDAVSERGTAYATRPASGSGSDDAGPWTMRGLDAVTKTSTGRNALTLTLTGIDAVSVDVAQARLSRTEPLVVSAVTDRAAVLHLDGLTVQLPKGSSRNVVPAHGPGGATVVAAPASRTLPATGGAAPWLAPLLVLVVMGAWRRRTA
jgi:pimeloyl-ACP methyl ester carboxylesterase